jgi:hypothetical protein
MTFKMSFKTRQWVPLVLFALVACGKDKDNQECFLEVLNCDDQVYLVYLDGDNAGTLTEGDDIETVPGLERLVLCEDQEYSGSSHNLDVRYNSNNPQASVTFRYDTCSSLIVANGQVNVDCDHMYCSYWSR